MDKMNITLFSESSQKILCDITGESVLLGALVRKVYIMTEP